MIGVNRHLFERLESHLPKENATVASLKIGSNSIRYIGTNDGSVARAIVKNASVTETLFAFDKSLILTLDFDKKTYLVITGNIENSTPFLKGIEPVVDPDKTEQDFKFNPGLATILFANDNFPTSIDAEKSYQLIETIFSSEKEGKSNGKFDLNELTEFFSDFSIWELGENFKPVNNNTLLAIYSGYIIEYSKIVNLNFSPSLNVNLKLIIEELPMDLIGGNIYRALTSMEWKHTFLELYQCIEYLFPIPYLSQLSSNIGYPTLFQKLFENTESDLGWRPKENEALSKLLKIIESKSSFTEMLTTLSTITNQTPNNPDNNIPFVTKHIYNTRNSIAHFRSSLKTDINSEQEWNMLIEKLCSLIYDLYTHFFNEISSIK